MGQPRERKQQTVHIQASAALTPSQWRDYDTSEIIFLFYFRWTESESAKLSRDTGLLVMNVYALRHPFALKVCFPYLSIRNRLEMMKLEHFERELN